MQIEAVSYSKLVNLGNYENQKITAHAKVEEGEAPEDALAKLKDWVDAQARQEKQVLSAESRLSRAQYELEGIKRQIEEAGEKWHEVQAFLVKHGVNPSRYGGPFDVPTEAEQARARELETALDDDEDGEADDGDTNPL